MTAPNNSSGEEVSVGLVVRVSAFTVMAWGLIPGGGNETHKPHSTAKIEKQTTTTKTKNRLGGKFKREEMHAYLWLIHVVV